MCPLQFLSASNGLPGLCGILVTKTDARTPFKFWEPFKSWPSISAHSSSCRPVRHRQSESPFLPLAVFGNIRLQLDLLRASGRLQMILWFYLLARNRWRFGRAESLPNTAAGRDVFAAAGLHQRLQSSTDAEAGVAVWQYFFRTAVRKAAVRMRLIRNSKFEIRNSDSAISHFVSGQIQNNP